MRMVHDVFAAAVRVAWSFLGPPPKLSRQLPCCLRFRDSDGFDNTSSIFENNVASKFSCEALRHTAFSVLFRAWYRSGLPGSQVFVMGCWVR